MHGHLVKKVNFSLNSFSLSSFSQSGELVFRDLWSSGSRFLVLQVHVIMCYPCAYIIHDLVMSD
jgi:hypothetical protein